MRTPLFLPEDALPLIVFFDVESRYERLVDSGLEDIWFKHRMATFRELRHALKYVVDDGHVPDLVLVSEPSWSEGGAELVDRVRRQPASASTLIYVVQLCGAFPAGQPRACADLRPLPSECDDKYFGRSEAYAHLLSADHPQRVDGVVCAASLRERLPAIVSEMADRWFEAVDA
jgi:hypothetical protein